ncbi:peptidase S8/S53 domain-containing protein [Kickxella alabastrina]|uniref:peptidase S8/S53 domain-containing protein n=1 Tax=Kickxella alabastrina TaxID=61397 RepID=UPI00221E8C8E|nr:peptidase S8/S53 domain-containing protein [Kickxella alabastrina]KAI7822295.1 peptidase S8/S53 domain-containing protein [Kickxella alabastrina]KAJ1946644.1 pheromone processing endoprotease [Kickxella alabastrina]
MKVKVLKLAAYYLQFNLALGNFILGPGLGLAPSDHSSKVNAWLQQAAQEPPAIPATHTDPAYHYTAVKFAATLPIDDQALEYAALTGWEHIGGLGSLPRYRVFRQKKDLVVAGDSSVVEAHGRMHRRAGDTLGVEHVEMMGNKRRLVKRGFGEQGQNAAVEATTWREIADPMYAQQWHLVNAIERGHDINVTSVWHEGITGVNVTVALIDDGLDYSSEDLINNFDYRGSYDFNDNTKLPTPRLVDDYHGTRCAGQIAAARNDVCGVGVAYGARVAGIRMLSREVTDQDEVSALNYAMDTNAIYSCSWGPNDDGATVQGPNKLVEDAFINGVENGRQGLGSVFVFATGNGGSAGDNCNFDGYTNSIYTISIGAIDHQDKHPYYSEQCSAQLAVTYSNGDGRGIVTTDLGLRACTNKHGGTSAAAPLGAGIFALALSVRPDLTWRDVQHVAVRSAVPVDLGDGDWTAVSQGRRYNHKYGFGKMDAWRIVQEAKALVHVGKQTRIEVARDDADEQIPPLEQRGGESKGIVRSVEITPEQVQAADMRGIEHVTVMVDMEHQFRGNVEIWLESPHGIRSQLAAMRQRDSSTEGLKGWRFMSVKHWGEDPVGTWSLHVRNAYKPKYAGKLKAWQLTVFGESTEHEERAEPPATNSTTPVTEPVPSNTPIGSGGAERVSQPSLENDGAGAGTGIMRKSVALLLSALLFVAGGVMSALGVLFFMCRRERRMSSARWTALDTMQNDDDEAFGYTGSRRQFVVDRPEDVFEFDDMVTDNNAMEQQQRGGDMDDMDDMDGRTQAAESSKGSGERFGKDHGESDRLV